MNEYGLHASSETAVENVGQSRKDPTIKQKTHWFTHGSAFQKTCTAQPTFRPLKYGQQAHNSRQHVIHLCFQKTNLFSLYNVKYHLLQMLCNIAAIEKYEF
jgi:hypothetical protein